MRVGGRYAALKRAAALGCRAIYAEYAMSFDANRERLAETADPSAATNVVSGCRLAWPRAPRSSGQSRGLRLRARDCGPQRARHNPRLAPLTPPSHGPGASRRLAAGARSTAT